MRLELVYGVVAAKSLGTCLTLAAGGIYLRRHGIVDKATTKALAKCFSQLFLPCLLFTRVVLSTGKGVFSRGLYLTASNVFLLLVGLFVGQLLLLLPISCCQPASRLRSIYRVAIWNNNGTGLPIVLATAVLTFAPRFQRAQLQYERHWQGNTSSTNSNETTASGSLSFSDADLLEVQRRQIQEAIGYIAFYALSYQTLAWTVGYQMLAPPTSSNASDSLSLDKSAMSDWTGVGQQLSVEKECMRDDKSGALNGAEFTQKIQLAPKTAATNLRAIFGFACRKILVPPVIGVLLGLVVGAVPFLHGLLTSGAMQATQNTETKSHIGSTSDPPLHFLFEAMTILGSVAPPLSMVILGANLTTATKRTEFSATADRVRNETKIHLATTGAGAGTCDGGDMCTAVLNGARELGGIPVLGAIALCKLILMPLAMYVLVRSLEGNNLLATIGLTLPRDNVLLLVIILESLTPSANNVVLMCTLHGHGAEEAAAVLLFQYFVGLLPMSIWITLFLSIIKL